MGDGKKGRDEGMYHSCHRPGDENSKSHRPDPLAHLAGCITTQTDPIAHRLITILAEKSAPTPPVTAFLTHLDGYLTV